jgi:hypothetical protein
MTLPPEIIAVLAQFAPVFSERVWDWAQVLVIGAILAPGKRTVSSILRVMGLGQEKQYQNYHRVLNRAKWSSLELSRRLLSVLVTVFVKDGVLVVGADETLERRRGASIAHLGAFRDAARSTQGHKVKSMGLRWLSMMVLTVMPWSARIWALPFLTVLAPGLKSDEAAGRRHKTAGEYLGQMLAQVRRWLPQQPLVCVVDGGLASLKLAQRCRDFETPITFVTRLQHNARLFDLPPEPKTKHGGRPRVVGARHPLLAQLEADTQTAWQVGAVQGYSGTKQTFHWVSAVSLWYTYGKTPLLGRAVWLSSASPDFDGCVLFATDPNASPEQIIAWFISRWGMEVTFEEVRAHLGFETQRQWNALAILRSSPALLALFSLVALLTERLLQGQNLSTRSNAWYSKPAPTFSDALAFVRQQLWRQTSFPIDPSITHSGNIPPPLLALWEEILCYAA